MEVNAIFADVVKIDERNNFKINLENEDEIIELLLNRKKDYYLTNAITYIENQRVLSQAIKDLGKIAKKHLNAERNNYLDLIIYSSLRLVFVTNGQILDKNTIPFWFYSVNLNDFKKYKKEYKYLDTAANEIKTFRVYDFLQHIQDGVSYQKIKLEAWIAAPIESVNLKLIENDTKILAKCNPSNDQTLGYWIYNWANTILFYDDEFKQLHATSTGWVEQFRRILDEKVKKKKKCEGWYAKGCICKIFLS